MTTLPKPTTSTPPSAASGLVVPNDPSSNSSTSENNKFSQSSSSSTSSLLLTQKSCAPCHRIGVGSGGSITTTPYTHDEAQLHLDELISHVVVAPVVAAAEKTNTNSDDNNDRRRELVVDGGERNDGCYNNNNNNWYLTHNGQRIKKVWKVKNFMAGIHFFEEVAKIAEREGHHPDIHLEGYQNVSIEMWTHSIGGLSENDFILAAKIDEVPVQLAKKRKKKKIELVKN